MDSKVGFEDGLAKDVVSSGLCVGCGACLAVCPCGCLAWAYGKPELRGECRSCGLCVKVCPKSCSSFSEVEFHVFGRGRTGLEVFGIHRGVYRVRSREDRVLKICQDGGAVTSLLLHALEAKLIDGAVLSGVSAEKPLFPVSRLAMSAEDVLSCAGSRYTCSPNLFGLTEAVKRGLGKVAFVGTPCQVQALRLMQMASAKLAKCVTLLLGLMCSECFQYEGLVSVLSGLGINLDEVEKVNIKGSMVVNLKSGVSREVSLSSVKKHALRGCENCGDFASELADLSLGGLGMEGWTGVVVRTKVGEDLLGSAKSAGLVDVENLGEDERPFRLLVRLSTMKRQFRVCL